MTNFESSFAGAQVLSRRALRASSVVLVLGLVACSSVLGIDELHEGPDPSVGATDAGGASGAGVNGGSKNPSGGNGATGNTTDGGDGSGGTSASGGSGGSGATGATGGTSTVPEGGDTGSGGSPDPDDPTVRGKVIDVWGQALSDVTVQIGDDMVTTNGLGEFTVEDVPAKYDVSLVVRPEGEDYGWYFVGVTRRNPTLQVYRGLDSRSGKIAIRPKNITPTDQQNITVAIGSPGGNWGADGIKQNGLDANPSWRGADTTTSTAHALLWTMDANDLPVSYQAYKAQTMALEEGGDWLPLDIDLSPVTGNLPAAAVQGVVTDNADGDRENNVFLRFTSHASIQLVNEYSAPDTFSYQVPTIANASVTVTATEGRSSGPFGLAHADGLAAGNTNVKLDIPTPPEPLLPPGGTTGVTVGTKLSYKRSPDHTGGAVIYIENMSFHQAMYIVTADSEVTIPEVAGGVFNLDKNQLYHWYIETHGQFDSVDDMTGADGFIDSFAGSSDRPTGMKTSSGGYSLSYWFAFTTAP